MKKLATACILFCMAFVAHAQILAINGTVSDTSGPLAAVTVMVKGTSNGTQSDFDGNYQISASKGDVLVFSYIGYMTKQIKVRDLMVINIVLEEDTQALDEIVVTGYSRNSRKLYTQSVSQVRREERKSYHNSIARQLKGRVAGIPITKAKNEIAWTRATTIKNIKEPLYIVDGVPIQKNYNPIVAKLDSDTIKMVDTYKGDRAKKMYGKVAKHGCVVITTKSGTYRIENDESYARITENQFEKVHLNPLSTFSIDVDKAAYSNIRRMINQGENIPVDAVKIEEIINYFEYDYPQPVDGHPFSINTEAAETPWNASTKLVRIGLQGKEYLNEELPPSNLTFLIDVSGSMDSHNKLPLLKSAFKLLVNQLREKDRVSIVVYAGAAGVVLKPTSGSRKETILTALDNLQAGGSTAGGEGIELAYALAQKNFKKNGNNRVVLATDGDFNVGASSDSAMEELIEEKRTSGVFLSVLGFGMGNYKDSKLEILADKGNGNHAYIDTMQEAQKVFGEEFGGTLYTIAKDVKIQVEFNPSKVQAYRLIGYENRMLADEDFIDDTKDAGELGSGHTVTALYEVIPVGVESDYIKDVAELKYTHTQRKTEYSDELLTVKFRYKKPDSDKSIEMVEVMNEQKSEMSTDFKFVSAVALFGMQLRKSAFTNGTDFEDVLELAESGRGDDRQGYRTEFIRLVNTSEHVVGVSK